MTIDDQNSRVRFGPFEADFRTQELWKHGIRLKLSGQPFQVLKMLISRPGELITRDELRNLLWPEDTFVDFRHGLNAAVNKLRETLGDSADNPKYIETLPRRGYRFIGQVEAPQPEPYETEIENAVPEPPAVATLPIVEAPIASMPHIQVMRSPSRRWRDVLALGAAAVLCFGLFAVVTKPGLDYLRNSDELSGLRQEGKNLIRESENRLREGQNIVRGIASEAQMPIKAAPSRTKSEPAPAVDEEPLEAHEVGAKVVPLVYTNSRQQFHSRTLIAGDGANSAPQFSPDGKRIAFMSDRSGRWQIWVSDADGANAKQLSFTESAGTPRWSPDGNSVAFDAPMRGETHIFVSNAATGEARPLTKGLVPSFSRDGKWIYFASDRVKGWQVWKAPVAGGDAVQLTTQGGFAALEASDGYVYYAKSRLPNPELWRVPVNGGEESQLARVRPRSWASWTVTAVGLLFAEDTPGGRPTLSLYDPESGQFHDLASLAQRPYWLGATKDARKIVMDESDRQITMLETSR
jgi:DNA-binding winged helix-turn-helix (wHTH) protein